MTKAKAKDDGLALFDSPAKEGEVIEAVAKTKPVKAGKSVAVHKPHPVVTAPAENAMLSLLQTVERLSTHPGVNPAIVEMLFKEMRDLRSEQAKSRFDSALAEVQGDLPIIGRKGKITVRAKDAKGERTGAVTQSTPYALYEDIVEKVLPIMSAKGLTISHVTDTEGQVKVESILSGYGHERRTKLTLMHDSTGSKNSVQAVVSSVSYAKRVNLCSLLSIATRGEDDDGSSAGGPVTVGEPITPDQIAELVTYREAVGCSPKHFMKHLNATRPAGHPEIQGLDFLPASRFEEAKAALQSFDDNRRKLEQERQANAGPHQK